MILRFFSRIRSRIGSAFSRLFVSSRETNTTAIVVRSLIKLASYGAIAYGAAYLMGFYLPTYVVAAIISVVAAHEFGHWLGRMTLRMKSAEMSGAHLHAPIEDVARSHLAGASWAFIAAVLGAGVAAAYGHTVVFWTFVWMA